MLTIVIPEREGFDENTNEFIIMNKQVTLTLEHSLVSISKWESKWKKSFLSDKGERTKEETIDYVRCMTITQNVDPDIFNYLTNDNYSKILEYIEDPMTASTVTSMNGKSDKQTITSELIYFWMVSLNIPFECQKWHINRLLMLIRICNAKNTTNKKVSKRSIAERNAALNEERRKKLNSKG